MPNHWIEHVKKYAKEKGMNYNPLPHESEKP
jgi:hypothetical protein